MYLLHFLFSFLRKSEILIYQENEIVLTIDII